MRHAPAKINIWLTQDPAPTPREGAGILA